MTRFHLSPASYDRLQIFVHQRHRRTYQIIARMLQLKPGEVVVEAGCGTGLLAEHFVAGGYHYWGFDPDADRITYARRRIPQGNFLVGEAQAVKQLDLPPFRQLFIHGILHHLPEPACREIIGALLQYSPELRLVIIEPYRPCPWWTNPLGALFALLDEGQYMRTYAENLALFGRYIDLIEKRSLWPYWPVPFLDARLIPASTISAAIQ